MNNKKYKNSSLTIYMPIILAGTLILGIFIGNSFDNKIKVLSGKTADDKIEQVLNFIDNEYVDTVNKEILVDKAVEAIMSSLDPHSTYIPPKEHEIAKASLEGKFSGIGVEFNIIRDTIVVVAPISGGPSEKAGIQAGDKIVAVNDSSITEGSMSIQKVFELLRGKKGSEVKLGIARIGRNSILHFDIIRDDIPTYSLDAAIMINDQLGYIKLNRFNANTYEEFKAGLKNLKEENMKDLILDLRDNPGGYLDQATKIIDEFMGKGKMIVYTKGKKVTNSYEYKSTASGAFKEGGLIVLVNEGSASASEIIAGAIQDNDRGLIVGRRTFGKGLVQYPYELKDNSEIRLTVSRYYTPSGRSIQRPYEIGKEKQYEEDLIERFEHGELYSRDSIKINKEKVYRTANGRKVYGGGGIIPDYFVSRDTTGVNELYTQLRLGNVLRDYGLRISVEEKNELKNMSAEDFISDFTLSEKRFSELKNLAKNQGINFEKEEWEATRELIEREIKAFIARSVFDNDTFYKILTETDPMIKASVRIINDGLKELLIAESK